MKDIRPFIKNSWQWVSREVRKPVKEWMFHPAHWLMITAALVTSEISVFRWLEKAPTSFAAVAWPLIAIMMVFTLRLVEKDLHRSDAQFRQLAELCDKWSNLYQRLLARIAEMEVRKRIH